MAFTMMPGAVRAKTVTVACATGDDTATGGTGDANCQRDTLPATQIDGLFFLSSLYVEISRARDRAELVTDDRAALKEQLEALAGERIAALEALGEGKAKAPEAAKAAGMDGESAGGPGHGPHAG